MERVQGYEYEMDVFRRNLLQPAAQQLERVQSDEYAQYVLARIFFQPAAQQVERVQRDGYEFYVWTVRLLQPAASRSLVPRRFTINFFRIGMTGSTFFWSGDLAICDLAIS